MEPEGEEVTGYAIHPEIRKLKHRYRTLLAELRARRTKNLGDLKSKYMDLRAKVVAWKTNQLGRARAWYSDGIGKARARYRSAVDQIRATYLREKAVLRERLEAEKRRAATLAPHQRFFYLMEVYKIYYLSLGALVISYMKGRHAQRLKYEEEAHRLKVAYQQARTKTYLQYIGAIETQVKRPYKMERHRIRLVYYESYYELRSWYYSEYYRLRGLLKLAEL